LAHLKEKEKEKEKEQMDSLKVSEIKVVTATGNKTVEDSERKVSKFKMVDAETDIN